MSIDFKNPVLSGIAGRYSGQDLRASGNVKAGAAKEEAATGVGASGIDRLNKSCIVQIPKSGGARPPLGEGAVRTFLDHGAKVYETADSFDGKLEVILDSAEGFVKSFADGGRSEAIAKLEAAVDEVARLHPGDAVLIGGLRRGIDNLRKKSEAVSEIRKALSGQLTSAVDDFKKAMKKAEKLPPNDRPDAKKEALDAFRKSIRKFRYEFDRKLSLDPSKYSRFRRWLDNFVSIWEWNKIPRWDDLEGEKDAVGKFAVAYNRLGRVLGGMLGDGRVIPAVSAEALSLSANEASKGFSDSLHEINNYIRGSLTSDASGGYYFEVVKSQLEHMAKNGGEKTTELHFGAGVGFKVGKVVDAEVGARFRYHYRIRCAGNGTVTVEHLGGGGAHANAKFGKEGALAVRGHAEGGGLVGRGKTFKNVNDAARYLCSDVGTLNPHFHYSAQSTYFFDKVIKTGFGILSLVKLIDKGLCRACCGRDYRTVRTDDHEFVADLKNRGILNKLSWHIMPGQNTMMSGTGETVELYGQADANVAIQAPVGRVNVEGGYEGTLHKGGRTVFKPYISSLEFDRAGEATERMSNVSASGGKPATVLGKGTFARALKILKGKTAAQADIVDCLLNVVKEVNDYAEKTVESRDPKKSGGQVSDDDGVVAEKYRGTALLAVALFEKWNGAKKPAGGDAHTSRELKARFEAVSARLRNMLSNPSVKLDKAVFNDRLMVKVEEGRNDYTTHKVFFSPSYDLTHEFEYNELLATEIDDQISPSAKTLAKRAGVQGLIGAASTFSALPATFEVEATFRNPKKQPAGRTNGNPRPWRQMRSTTVNVRTVTDCPLIFALFMPLASHLAREAGKKEPKTMAEAKKIIYATLGVGVSAALTRVTKDIFYSKVMEKSGSQAIAEDVIGAASGTFSFSKWKLASGRNIQFVIEGGRLRSIGIGNHYKVNIGGDLNLKAAPVVLSGGLKMDSVSNNETYWLHPSFNSLAAKCEDYMQVGNCTEWNGFVTENRKALSRLADIVANGLDDENRIKHGDGRKWSENDKEDIQQFHDAYARIMEQNESLPPGIGEADAKLIQTNKGNLETAVKALKAHKGAKSLRKARLMQKVLDCIVRHHALMDAVNRRSEERPRNHPVADTLVIAP